MSDIDLSEGTTEDVAANFLREAFAQGKHGPSDGWALWPRAERLSAAIEAAVRERVAREIEAQRKVTRFGMSRGGDIEFGRDIGFELAAAIARGES